MQQQYPFQANGMSTATPTAQTTAAITAGVTQLTLPVIDSNGGSLRLVVNSTANVSWCYGTNANLTIDNGCFMLTNTTDVFTLPPGVTVISLIGSAANGNLRAMVGQGM